MFIRIRRNPSVDELQLTLFHEALHLMSWIINTHGAPRISAPNTRAMRALTLSMFPSQIATIRLWLDQLAGSVNGRRSAAGQSRLTTSGITAVAEFLLEEVQVRAETEVFRLALAAQQARATRGPVVIQGTAQNTEVNRSMVDRYIFDFSRRFLPGDRTGLTANDRQTIDTITQILEGLFQFQVRRRFSLTAHTISIPRTPFQYAPPPLTPPPFRPLPVP
jgi:hypothetical protein